MAEIFELLFIFQISQTNGNIFNMEKKIKFIFQVYANKIFFLHADYLMLSYVTEPVNNCMHFIISPFMVTFNVI